MAIQKDRKRLHVSFQNILLCLLLNFSKVLSFPRLILVKVGWLSFANLNLRLLYAKIYCFANLSVEILLK